MPKKSLAPDWERVLHAAAHLQKLIPGTTLVGGSAAAIYANHRVSWDADHVLPDLRERFDEILAELESVAGWVTAKVTRPVIILGSLDGIETGVRQLIRTEPLETTTTDINGCAIVVPTNHEILRIKGILILKRNATRDYLDFAALGEKLGMDECSHALAKFDILYPQKSGESSLQQLYAQLASPMPYDFKSVNLTEYKNLTPKLQNWNEVINICQDVAIRSFDDGLVDDDVVLESAISTPNLR